MPGFYSKQFTKRSKYYKNNHDCDCMTLEKKIEYEEFTKNNNKNIKNKYNNYNNNKINYKNNYKIFIC
jgi:hypothetical protein